MNHPPIRCGYIITQHIDNYKYFNFTAIYSYEFAFLRLSSFLLYINIQIAIEHIIIYPKTDHKSGNWWPSRKYPPTAVKITFE